MVWKGYVSASTNILLPLRLHAMVLEGLNYRLSIFVYTVCLASHLCPVRSLFIVLTVSRSFDALGVQVGLVVLGACR